MAMAIALIKCNHKTTIEDDEEPALVSSEIATWQFCWQLSADYLMAYHNPSRPICTKVLKIMLFRHSTESTSCSLCTTTAFIIKCLSLTANVKRNQLQVLLLSSTSIVVLWLTFYQCTLPGPRIWTNVTRRPLHYWVCGWLGTRIRTAQILMLCSVCSNNNPFHNDTTL